jgi:hypothetical protein
MSPVCAATCDWNWFNPDSRVLGPSWPMTVYVLGPEASRKIFRVIVCPASEVALVLHEVTVQLVTPPVPGTTYEAPEFTVGCTTSSWPLQSWNTVGPT